jgi:hypothetical protein
MKSLLEQFVPSTLYYYILRTISIFLQSLALSKHEVRRV